jgi:hypothetical protein
MLKIAYIYIKLIIKYFTLLFYYIKLNKMNIPLDVIRLFASYLVEPKMKLLDWIPLDKLDWVV